MDSSRASYLLGFILANEESTKKSKRLRELWANKRKIGGSLGGLCPAWLKWDGATYSVLEDRAAVVRLMFNMSADGLGAYAIKAARGGLWNHSSVSKLLHNRAVIGECVFTEVVNGKRVPAATVKQYYPPIVDRNVFFRVQQNLKARDAKAGFRGRGARTVKNLFAGLLVDARDKGSLVYYEQRKKNKTWKYVGSHNAMRKVPGACLVTFPYEPLEVELLVALPHLGRADFFAGQEADVDVDAKEGELAEVRQNIDVVKKRIVGGSSAATLVGLLEELDAKAAALAAEVERLRGRTAKDDVELLDELADALAGMRAAQGEERRTIRQRLQGRLRVLIDNVYVLLSKSRSATRGNPYDKHAVVEIRFRNGSYWQMSLSWIGGEIVRDWDGVGPSITKLPDDFDVADPLAILKRRH